MAAYGPKIREVPAYPLLSFVLILTGMPLHSLNGHEDWVWSVAVSDDGKFAVSSADDRTVRVWDIATGVNWQTEVGVL